MGVPPPPVALIMNFTYWIVKGGLFPLTMSQTE